MYYNLNGLFPNIIDSNNNPYNNESHEEEPKGRQQLLSGNIDKVGKDLQEIKK